MSLGGFLRHLTGIKSQCVTGSGYFRKCWSGLGKVAEYCEIKMSRIYETGFDKGLILDRQTKLLPYEVNSFPLSGEKDPSLKLFTIRCKRFISSEDHSPSIYYFGSQIYLKVIFKYILFSAKRVIEKHLNKRLRYFFID